MTTTTNLQVELDLLGALQKLTMPMLPPVPFASTAAELTLSTVPEDQEQAAKKTREKTDALLTYIRRLDRHLRDLQMALARYTAGTDIVLRSLVIRRPGAGPLSARPEPTGSGRLWFDTETKILWGDLEPNNLPILGWVAMAYLDEQTTAIPNNLTMWAKNGEVADSGLSLDEMIQLSDTVDQVVAELDTVFHNNVAAEINALTDRPVPVNADVFVIEDSSASWEKKKLSIANLMALAPKVDLQVFTTPGAATWTKPTNPTPTVVRVIAYGGGGGGGGGASNTGAVVRCGGSGGGGGARVERTYRASDLGATEAITVGAAGNFGTGGASGASGVSGAAGGNSIFSSGINLLTAYGGGGGRLGANSAAAGGGGGGGGTGVLGGVGGTGVGAGGGPGAPTAPSGGCGADGSATATAPPTAEYGGAGGGGHTNVPANSVGGGSMWGGCGGGVGGGATVAPALVAATSGGSAQVGGGGGGAAGGSGAAPTAGGVGSAGGMGRGGRGGGGGGGTITANTAGAVGGAGGQPGGGGGGGGIGCNTGAGGNGGLGGAGAVYVISW